MRTNHKLYMDPKTGRKSRLYSTWEGMKARCYSPNNCRYKLYGARGITVCDQWRNDFRAFYEWAMANGYQSDLTIDRIDVNGNYEPSNCRWATYKEQGNNRRTCLMLTYNGVTKSATMWAADLGAGKHLVMRRIHRGWSVERAVTTPK